MTAKLEIAKKLIQILNVDNLMDVYAESMIASDKELSPMEKLGMTHLMSEFKPKFIEKFAQIYCEKFEAEELEKILEFYKTEIGKKLIEKMPEISSEAQLLGIELAGELANKFKL